MLEFMRNNNGLYTCSLDTTDASIVEEKLCLFKKMKSVAQDGRYLSF